MTHQNGKDALQRWQAMVRPRGPGYARSRDDDLDAAVGQFLLGGIQKRLLNWTGVARELTPRVPREVEPFPVHLLTINWASSGPGYDWPEAYFASHVVEIEMVVVIASRDSAEMWGYTDHAIGWLPIGGTPGEGTAEVIGGWWKSVRGKINQPPWDSVWNSGAISDGEASELRSRIWGD